MIIEEKKSFRQRGEESRTKLLRYRPIVGTAKPYKKVVPDIFGNQNYDIILWVSVCVWRGGAVRKRNMI